MWLPRNIYSREHPEDSAALTAGGDMLIKEASDAELLSELFRQTLRAKADGGEQGERTTALWHIWGLSAEIEERLVRYQGAA